MTYPAWLSSAVGYQVYPQSFFDTNGDGIGDLRGVIEKLDYIAELGADLIWLNPCFVSPMRDAGYDIADYLAVDPRYATNADLERLLAEAHRRGMRVLLDLVAGHTSDQHPWFRRAAKAERNEMTDRYIWAESGWRTSDGDIRFISGNADHGAYAINFFANQPALNYGFAHITSPYQQHVDDPGPRATREALRDVMRFWLDRGVDGFRVDMAYSLVKNDRHGLENRRLWREFRAWLDDYYPGRILLSEWGIPEIAVDGGFHLDFMLHIGAPGYDRLFFNEFGRRSSPAAWFDRRGKGSFQPFWDSWSLQERRTRGRGLISLPTANHDFQRPMVGNRDQRDLAVIFAFLMTWPCVPFIYYGDEIGMRFIDDLPSKEGGYDRTGSRTPMQWSRGRNAGFSAAPRRDLYLPVDPSPDRPDVHSQQRKPGSLWRRAQDLIHLRRSDPDLRPEASLDVLTPTDPGFPLAYVRGGRWLVVLNPSGRARRTTIAVSCAAEPVAVEGVEATLRRGRTSISAAAASYGVFRLA